MRKDVANQSGGEYNGENRLYDPKENTRSDSADLKKAGDAKGRIDDFREINGKDISYNSKSREKDPYKDHGQKGIDDVDDHAVELLSHSFE